MTGQDGNERLSRGPRQCGFDPSLCVRKSPTKFYRALSLECCSISFLVIKTSPKICVHSETMFPTTCPHLASESIAAYSAIQPTPVISRKMLREWFRSRSRKGLSKPCGGRRLSAEPRSYKYFVATTMTTTPDQSA